MKNFLFLKYIKGIYICHLFCQSFTSSTDKIDISAVKPVNTGFFRVLRTKKRGKKP